MIIRNGINSKLRARGRSLLFFFLIVLLTTTMVLGYGVQLYCDSVFQRSDEIFHSIIKVEYLGAEYPYEDEADPQARKAYEEISGKKLSEIDGVKDWYPTIQAMYSAEGYTRWASPVPFSQYGILRVGHLGQTEIQSDWKTVDSPKDDLYLVWDLEAGLYVLHDHEKVTEYPYIVGNKKGLFEQKKFNPEGSWITEPVPSVPERCILEAPGSVIYEQTGVGSPLSHVVKTVALGIDGEDPLGDWPFYRFQASQNTYTKEEKYIAAYGSAIIQETLFSNDDPSNALIKIYLNNFDFQAKPDQEYLIHGYYGDWLQGVQSFYLDSFLWDPDPLPFAQVHADPENDLYFEQTADLYRKANHGLMLTVCPDLSLLEEFHQKDLLVEKGKFPQNEKEILITPDIASKLEKEVGDTLELTRLFCEEEDRYHIIASGDTVHARIVGITSKHADYVGRVWTCDESFCTDTPFFGYTLGLLSVENAQGAEIAAQLDQSEDTLIHATLMDQGYSQMVRPLKIMSMMAKTVLWICALGVLAVLILFAYLFVGKEKETLTILHSLGVGSTKSAVWVLSGAWVISLSACLVGNFGGMALLKQTITLAMEAANRILSSGTEFSEKYLGIIQSQAVEVQLPLGSVWFASLGIFVLGMLLCFLFLQIARKQGRPNRGKSHLHVPRSGTSTAGRGSLRFAFLSIQRGGGRSVVVPMVSAALSVLIIVLCSIQQSWIHEKEQAYQENILSGELISLNGQFHDQLVVPLEQVWKLQHTDMLETLSLSYGWKYWLEEEMPHFAANSFGQERRMAYIMSRPSLTAISDLTVGKDFYYRMPSIQWLDGWDTESFVNQEYEPLDIVSLRNTQEAIRYAVLAGSDFAKQHDLQCGDSFRCTILGQFHEIPLTLQIVGIFTQQGSRSQLYVPFSCAMKNEWIQEEENRWKDPRNIDSVLTPVQAEEYLIQRMAMDSVRFSVKAEDLEMIRAALHEQGFSQVRRPGTLRYAALLKDRVFTNLVDDLNRQISLGQIIFSMIFVMAALLAFVVSWLLINGRKTEFAIMRGLGASRLRVFASFFWEQVFLCLFGFGLGLMSLVFLKASGSMLWKALAAFLISYLTGSALSVLLIGRMNLMELLAVRD